MRYGRKYRVPVSYYLDAVLSEFPVLAIRGKGFAYTQRSISAFDQIYSFLCGYFKQTTFIHRQGVTKEFGDTLRYCER
jgi:hypothetical protein